MALPFFSKEPGFLEKISLVQYDDADLIQVTPGPSMPEDLTHLTHPALCGEPCKPSKKNVYLIY